MSEVANTILFYTSEDGRCPFLQRLRRVKDLRTKQIIEARIERMKFGNLGDCKAISNGIFETRIHFGPGYRIYYAEIQKRTILLLIIGDKSRQNEDIKKAKKFWKEHNES